jgi:hypothetical protein
LWRALVRQGIFNPGTNTGRLVRRIHSPFDAFERASDAVARGNLKVFAEIGLAFAQYLHSGLDGLLPVLRPGPPPEGQDYLRRAFSRYHRLMPETPPGAVAQQVFLANIEIGLHEQTRLQPEIQEALEAVPDTADDLGGRVFPLLRIPARRFHRFSRELTRRVITESLMGLSLPEIELALGRHLDVPYPELLLKLTDSELEELLREYEPRGAVCDNCGADDWADLRQRMHYIIHLFRAFHLRAAEFPSPFSAAQTKLILAGLLPEGSL